MTPLTLDEWDYKIRPHLRGIRDGAEMITRHVGQMIGRPEFETKAFDDLVVCEIYLENALARVRAAKLAFQEKPTIA